MNQSESITELAKALATFQVKANKIIKKAENPFFKSKYADLPSILDEISLPLSESGLVISQWPDGDGLTTMLIHAESGQFISANGTMHPVKSDPQSMGSAITYQRRYSICSILMLNVDSDDDGNAASDVEQIKSPQSNKPKPQPNRPTQWLNEGTPEWAQAATFMAKATDKQAGLKSIMAGYSVSKDNQAKLLAL